MAQKRKRRTPAEVAAAQRAADETKIVLWAETHGAPIALLVGWDKDTGTWTPESPVGVMLAHVRDAVFPTVAARLAGVTNIAALLAKGTEYAQDAPEERDYVPVEIRPFIDLTRAMDVAESLAEIDITRRAFIGAKRDPKVALTFLSRRFASRWREQSAVFTAESADEHDKAVSEALGDPNTALALAEIGHRIEDVTVHDDD